MTPDAVREKIGGCPLTRISRRKERPCHHHQFYLRRLCYDATRVEETLGKSVDSIHFDEAWYGYARFNPLYTGRFAMRDGREIPPAPPSLPPVDPQAAGSPLPASWSMSGTAGGRSSIRVQRELMMHSSTRRFTPSWPFSMSRRDDGRVAGGPDHRIDRGGDRFPPDHGPGSP